MQGYPEEVAVIIGRFQPFHQGHAVLLERALATASRVIIILGSSFHARSPKNPFTWQERSDMIQVTLDGPSRERVRCVPVRDYYDDQRWADAVHSAVKLHAGGASKVALVGYFKDASSYYLKLFPRWKLITAEDPPNIDATRIRRILFETEDADIALKVVADLVPLAVRHYLQAWMVLPPLPLLAAEHKKVLEYQAAWKSAPYPPIFVTVDAIIVTAGHVLLVKRGAFPGKGNWALPGGFLDQNERLLTAAIREVYEETELAVLPSMLADALVDVRVFDHPDRSLRGRTITHGHYFDLRTDALPAIHGADDAELAAWVPIAQLGGMEDTFHDDHFHILDHFLRLTERRE